MTKIVFHKIYPQTYAKFDDSAYFRQIFIAIGVPLPSELMDERQAENIPFEPDADNADAGNKKNSLYWFNCQTLKSMRNEKD